MKKKPIIITQAVIDAAKEWQAQPSSKAIMAQARARCKALKTLQATADAHGVDYWAVRKYIFNTIHKP